MSQYNILYYLVVSKLEINKIIKYIFKPQSTTTFLEDDTEWHVDPYSK